jgi:integrase
MSRQQGSITRGGKPRKVPTHPAVQEALVRWAEHAESDERWVLPSQKGNHLQERGFDSALRRILKRAAVEGSAKVLRATLNSSLADNDGDERYIEGILAHAGLAGICLLLVAAVPASASVVIYSQQCRGKRRVVS